MFKKLVIVFIALFIFIFGAFQWIAHRSVPPINGEINLSGLTSEVKTHIDINGVPHIFAQNENDAFKTLGYLMASERLFQMDIYRRLGSGTLSEYFGEKAYEMDKLSRVLGFSKNMKKVIAKYPLPEKAQALMDSFIDGVNQFIENGPKPLEYWILFKTPPKFKVEDVYGMIGFMSFRFAIALKQDLLFSELKSKLSPELFEALRIEPENKALRFSENVTPNWKKIEKALGFLEDHLVNFEGSNAWIISKEKSKSGKPILASDPHIGYSLPHIWYEAHISTPTYESYGHYLPILPFPVLHHNRDYAIGLTISYIDDWDFYKIKDLGNGYEYEGEKRPYLIDKEIINVAGEKRELVIKSTHHGPIIDSISKEKNLAAKWAFALENNRAIEALYWLSRSQDVANFRDIVKLVRSPGLNILYADNNNIARFIAGAIPIRPEGIRGDVILDGSKNSHEYQGYVDYYKKPFLMNPKEGFIVSANYRPENTDRDIQGDWQGGDRYKTIYSELAKINRTDALEMKKLQVDNADVENQKIKTYLQVALEDYVDKFSNHERKAYNDLKEWDLKSTAESRGAAIFHVLNDKLLFEFLGDLDEETKFRYCRISAGWHFYKRTLYSPESSPWLRDKKLGDLVFSALKKTVTHLKEKIGSNYNEWKWGKIHTIEFIHPLGRVKPLNYIFNVGPYEVSGAYNHINNVRRVGCRNGHIVKAGPSTRRIIDMKTPTFSFGGLPLGNSGHLKSPFFQNERKNFFEGTHRAQFLDLKMIKAHQKGELVFKVKKR